MVLFSGPNRFKFRGDPVWRQLLVETGDLGSVPDDHQPGSGRRSTSGSTAIKVFVSCWRGAGCFGPGVPVVSRGKHQRAGRAWPSESGGELPRPYVSI